MIFLRWDVRVGGWWPAQFKKNVPVAPRAQPPLFCTPKMLMCLPVLFGNAYMRFGAYSDLKQGQDVHFAIVPSSQLASHRADTCSKYASQ